MSNDLISRSALISHIESESGQWGADYDTEQILGDIEDAPTVYDVEKVVEQIKTLSPANYITKDDVLKIVKGGGVNE